MRGTCVYGVGWGVPPVLSLASTAIALSFVICCGCAARRVAESYAFWVCRLPLLDDLHAVFCRSCESRECEFAAGTGLADFSPWRALEALLQRVQQRWRCMGPGARMRPYVVGGLLVVSCRLLVMAAGRTSTCFPCGGRAKPGPHMAALKSWLPLLVAKVKVLERSKMNAEILEYI